MKCRTATRHNQFDDWIAFLLVLFTVRFFLDEEKTSLINLSLPSDRRTDLLIKRPLSAAETKHARAHGVTPLTIDSAGQAHQNGCDMTRNIPQPIWCIGPQKVFSFRVPSGSLDSVRYTIFFPPPPLFRNYFHVSSFVRFGISAGDGHNFAHQSWLW